MALSTLLHPPNGRPPTRRQIRDPPERYRYLVESAALLLIWLADLSVPSEPRTKHPALVGRRTHPNDFLDAQIASKAAYEGIIVVEDKHLRGRCEFLRARGLLGFRSVDVDTFFAS